MYIHRYYNAAGPTAEALLLQAFMLYLAGRANAAQTEPPAHTGARLNDRSISLWRGGG